MKWPSPFSNPVTRTALPLATGAALGQVIALLFLPFLSRRYSPQAFAQLALFQSGMNLLAPFACLKYDLAIPVLEEKDAGAIFRLCCQLPMVFALLLLPISLWKWDIPAVRWLWAALLLPGWYGAASAACLRLNQEWIIGLAALCKGALGSLFALLLPQETGLILGQLIGWLAGTGLLLWAARPLRGRLPLSEGRRLLWQYKSYPSTLLIGAVSVGAVFSLADYGVAALYSEGELATYAMALRLLFAPIGLLTGPASQAYLKTASQQYREEHQLPVLGHTLRLFGLLALAIYGAFFLLAEPIVTIVLGPGWEAVPSLLRLLAPMAALRFAITTISFTPVVLGKNRLLMFWQCSLLAIGAGVLAYCWQTAAPFAAFGFLFSAGLGGGYLALALLCIYLIPKEEPHGPPDLSYP